MKVAVFVLPCIIRPDRPRQSPGLHLRYSWFTVPQLLKICLKALYMSVYRHYEKMSTLMCIGCLVGTLCIGCRFVI